MPKSVGNTDCQTKVYFTPVAIWNHPTVATGETRDASGSSISHC